MYALYNQADIDRGRDPGESLVVAGSRPECVDYLRAHDPHLRHLYLLPLHLDLEVHRYFYPDYSVAQEVAYAAP